MRDHIRSTARQLDARPYRGAGTMGVILTAAGALLLPLLATSAEAVPIVDRFDDTSADAWQQVAFEDFAGFTTGASALDGQGDGSSSVGWSGPWDAGAAFGVGVKSGPNSGASASSTPHAFAHSNDGGNGTASRSFASAIAAPPTGSTQFALSYHGGSGTRNGRPGPHLFLVDDSGNRLFGGLYDGGGGTDGDQFNYHLSDGDESNTTASTGVGFPEKNWRRVVIHGDWSATGDLALSLWVDPSDTVDETNPDAKLALTGVTADIAALELPFFVWSGPGDSFGGFPGSPHYDDFDLRLAPQPVPTTVPEPAALGLLGLAGLALGGRRRVSKPH